MKKISIISLLLLFLIACGEKTEKKADQNTDEVSAKKVDDIKALPSADYSSLFINYECDLTAAEVAKIFEIPESDVSITKIQKPGRCSFYIKGFGKNGLGEETTVEWLLEKPGKAQVNKEIKSYLDDQANNESVLGMGIELSETKDSYITMQPMHGRVAIMNGNYDSWMFINYSQKGLYKGRTKEQHTDLGVKTIALANYLLKKHKK